MSQNISALKAQAQNLRAALEKSGTPATLAFAQELLAQQYGLADWNTLVALADKKPSVAPAAAAEKAPRLCDVPAIPDELHIECGSRTLSYDIQEFDEDFMRAMGDPQAIQALFDAHPHLQNDRDSTTVIMGYGDGEDVELTVADLQDAKGQVLAGTAYWTLADGRIISFVHGKNWAPDDTQEPPQAAAPALVVPALMARSSRGCSVTSVKAGLAVLPANMSQSRFQELLADRLPSPLEATDATVDAMCAQLGVQWLDGAALQSAGLTQTKEPSYAPTAKFVIGEHDKPVLQGLRSADTLTENRIEFFVPVSAWKVQRPTADYQAAAEEVSTRATGSRTRLVHVDLYPADPRGLPKLSSDKLEWVRVRAAILP